MHLADFFSAFIMAMVELGITPPTQIINDGQIHRFSSNGKSSDSSGYYAFFSHPNGFNAGFFGCWRTGLYSTWSSKEEFRLQPHEAEFLRQCKAEAQKARESVYKDRSEYAQSLWDKAEPAPVSHPYLQRKQLSTVGGDCFSDSLAVS
ncbi:hypothetical protein [Photobacterium sp. TLY01]|uniref:hypothetical protein n=1 Tax=Photobacterium sp. TLY01 TaxID=2907534 RepID=UPI001F478295|nr:hypothetical protein [Photobacterium sp. TLY01]UIP27775.1 hypothetical protein LN341_14500 [Photobacterium sp. TLY01]